MGGQEPMPSRLFGLGVVGLVLLAFGCVGLIASNFAESETSGSGSGAQSWDIIQPQLESLSDKAAPPTGNSTGATGILGVVSKFNGKKSFDEHVYDVIKKHGDFPVDHAVDFMRDVSAYNKKTEEHLDTEAQAYDAIHSAATSS